MDIELHKWKLQDNYKLKKRKEGRKEPLLYIKKKSFETKEARNKSTYVKFKYKQNSSMVIIVGVFGVID